MTFNNRGEFQQAYAKEDDRHAKAIQRLKAALKELQGRCSHKQTTFFGDPAGGNDSYYRCDLCDKSL